MNSDGVNSAPGVPELAHSTDTTSFTSGRISSKRNGRPPASAWFTVK